MSRHRVEDAAAALDAAVDRLARADLDTVPADALTALVRSIARVETRLTAITARAVAVAERTGTVEATGSSTPTTWLADATGASPHSASRAVSLGRAIEAAPAVAAGVSDGSLSADKASSLARALDRGVLDARAVDSLVADARDLPAGVFARHVRAREAAEDNARLRADEQWARARRSVTHRRLEDGSVEGTFRLAPVAGDTVLTALRAVATVDPADTPPDQRRTSAMREADAFEALARHALDRGAGGDELNVRPHVSVVVPVAALAPDGDDAVAAGALGITDHGTVLSTQAVRTLLCDAAVRRVVVDPAGQPLDVGRATRSWSGAQRSASAAVDGGCRGPSCDRPFAWTQLHHIDWWRHGGHTDLDRGVPLCGHCHHLVHDDGWTVELDPGTRIVTWTSPSGATSTNRPRGPAATLRLLAATPSGATGATGATGPPGGTDPPPAPAGGDPPRTLEPTPDGDRPLAAASAAPALPLLLD